MELIERLRQQARQNLRTIVLPEGMEERVIKAASYLYQNKIVSPVLLGNPEEIREKAQTLHTDISEIEIIDPSADSDFENYVHIFYELRKHKNISLDTARKLMRNPLYFGAMMVREGRAAGAVAGSINTTGDVLRAAIPIIGLAPGISVVSSCFLMVMPSGQILTFGDCAVIPDPDPQQLASIAISSARTHQKLVGTEPLVAMLSFSTKGSASHPMVEKVVQATHLVQQQKPELKCDGELQFDAAYVPEVGQRKAPDSPVAGQANVFIFPDLDAGNIGYKMVERLSGAQAVGPIIQGLAKPYNDLSRGCSVDDIINVAAICSILS